MVSRRSFDSSLVTPLVNAVFIVLVIFLLASSLLDRRVVDVNSTRQAARARRCTSPWWWRCAPRAFVCPAPWCRSMRWAPWLQSKSTWPADPRSALGGSTPARCRVGEGGAGAGSIGGRRRDPAVSGSPGILNPLCRAIVSAAMHGWRCCRMGLTRFGGRLRAVVTGTAALGCGRAWDAGAGVGDRGDGSRWSSSGRAD